MSGRCYSCTTGFTVFKREYGCKNCGFAFCKDCVSKKVPLPKLKNEAHRVCNKCHAILTGKAKPETSAKYSPPDAHKKRMAALETKPGPASHPHTSSHGAHNHRQPVDKFKGLTKEDAAIAERLEKLKESRKPVAVPSQQEMEERVAKLKENPNAPAIPTQDEMQARLARLKGQDPSSSNSSSSSKPHVFPTDRRSQQQQIDDLLSEICDEVEIDSHAIIPADDVQSRLNQLRGHHDNTDSGNGEDNNLNKSASLSKDSYTKNIPVFDETYKPSAEEDIDVSEMNALMARIAQEMDVDASRAMDGLRKDKELWAQLQAIKLKQGVKGGSGEAGGSEGTEATTDDALSARSVEGAATGDSDEENEDNQTRAVIERILAEQELEDRLDASAVTEGALRRLPAPPIEATAPAARPPQCRVTANEDEDADELPWCCICNSDAVMRCRGCDGDLYCRRCYKEGHDRDDTEDHPTVPYKSKK